MENNQQTTATQAEEVRIENKAQEFEQIKEEPSQEQEPGFVGKAWNKTQEIAGSTVATVKEKPVESAVIAGLGYAGIKFIGWVAGKLCSGDKKD
jgi:hypothetical protein